MTSRGSSPLLRERTAERRPQLVDGDDRSHPPLRQAFQELEGKVRGALQEIRTVHGFPLGCFHLGCFHREKREE